MPRTHADLIGWSFRTCQGLWTPCECPRVQERWLQPLPTGAECVHQADRARCYIWLALSGLPHHLACPKSLRGYPETFLHCCNEIKQHPCGNETRGDRRERVY